MITQNIITEKNLSELDVITRLFEQVVELYLSLLVRSRRPAQ